MFRKFLIRITRSWQAQNKLVGLVVWSHGQHSESVVLLDNAGSAYQVAIHGSGFHLRPSVTVSEYLPENMRVIQQYSFFTTLLSLRARLSSALSEIERWMKQNNAVRLPHDEEMKLVQSMYARRKGPNQSTDPTPAPVTPVAGQPSRQP
jgi:hypothetical protein